MWGVRICVGLVLGGAIGNQIDRTRVGHVTDFLLFQLPVGDRVYSWPAWNVADASIVVGTILLALLLLRAEGRSSLDRQRLAGEEVTHADTGGS
jgi:signal peptidase II